MKFARNLKSVITAKIRSLPGNPVEIDFCFTFLARAACQDNFSCKHHLEPFTKFQPVFEAKYSTYYVPLKDNIQVDIADHGSYRLK